MSDEPIRVVIVDDQELVRGGFGLILSAAPGIRVVGEAATGREAIDVIARERPHVVTMDVQMPDMDGLEATRGILAQGGIAPAVIVLTTFDRDDYLFAALEAGASGFLLKTSSPEDLVAAVRLVASGDALLSPDMTRRLIARFAAREATTRSGRSRPGPTVPQEIPSVEPVEPVEPVETRSSPVTIPETGQSLTEREAEVLGLLAEGLSNAEIGLRLFIGEATVKTHVSRILQKIGVRDRIHAVVYAHRRGLVAG